MAQLKILMQSHLDQRVQMGLLNIPLTTINIKQVSNQSEELGFLMTYSHLPYSHASNKRLS